MNVVNLMILFLMSFTFLNFIFSIKAWINLKNYKEIVKGIVSEACLHNDKIFLNIKWHLPEEIIEKSIKSYAHIYKDVSKMTQFKKRLLLMKTNEKFSNKPFYLLLKKDNNIVSDIKPYKTPLRSAILNGLLFILLCSWYYIHNS